MGADGGVAYITCRNAQAAALTRVLLEPWSRVFTASGSDTGDDSRSVWEADQARLDPGFYERALIGPYGTDIHGASLDGLPDFLDLAETYAAGEVTLADFAEELATDPQRDLEHPRGQAEAWAAELASYRGPLRDMPLRVWVDSVVGSVSPEHRRGYSGQVIVTSEETWT